MKKTLIISFILLTLIATGCSEKNSIAAEDLVFKLDSGSISLDSDASVLINLLGDGYTLTEAPSCLFEGNDKIYSYEDKIEIYTYPKDGKDLIDEIMLLSPGFATSKGIKVGDTVEQLMAAYGDGYTDDGGLITYRLRPGEEASPSLYFVTENDIITAISFYSASNMAAD